MFRRRHINSYVVALPKITRLLDISSCVFQKVVGLEVHFCIRLYLLGDPSTDDIAPVYAEWVQTAIMLGRKLLVQQWKSAHAPPITDWYNGLTIVTAYEQVSFTLLYRLDWYFFKWQKFLQYINGSRCNVISETCSYKCI